MLKRGFDVFLVLTLATMAGPVILLFALLTRIVIGSPVLFRQQRPGRNGNSFEMVKFRTMHNLVDAGGHPLPDNARIGRFGRLARTISIDELPELWNVLKGDMSLVGPRPLLMEYLPLYSDIQARRHEVRPGITGWAQVNGRNALSWEEKFALDVWYVDNQSLWLDLKILGLTVLTLLRPRGINQPGHATMERFRGAEK